MSAEIKNTYLADLCDKVEKCYNCPLKSFFPECGNGWHIAMDSSEEEQKAALLIFEGANRLKEYRKKEESA